MHTATTTHTPTRTGGDLDAPSPGRDRAKKRSTQHAGDDEFRSRHQLSGRGRVGSSLVTIADSRRVVRFPTLGWPALNVPNETDSPLLDHKISDDAHLRGPHPNHTFARELGVGPLSVDSVFAGATTAPHHAFRTTDGDGALECALVGSQCQAWKLTQRIAKREGRHH